MTFFDDLFMPAARPATPAAGLSLTDPAGWGGATWAGSAVSAETALRVSTVWACIRIISDTIGFLPLLVYRRLANGDRERASGHPLYSILRDQPNNAQTAFQFRKMLTAHLLLRGNGYALIQPGPRGFADQLIPLAPDRMEVETTADNHLRYQYTQANGVRVTYTDDQIFHLRGLSLDGVTGVGVVEYARETIGVALAREQYGARFFSNDSTPGGLLKTAGKLSDAAAQRVSQSWANAHAGPRMAHKVAVLEEGLEYQAIGMTNRDSQFLELGEFTAEQIAGQWFGVPPHMVGLTSKSTSWGSGIEEMGQQFITYTLQPWLTEWQQSISRDLILATDTYWAEFLTQDLLRGRLLDRYNAYAIARDKGWMSPNEIRRAENMPQRNDAGGDAYVAAPPGGPAPQTDDSANAHYSQLIRAAAGRLARKEKRALETAAKRGENWSPAVTDFYSGHAALVAESLAVPEPAAWRYASSQAQKVILAGPAGLTPDFEERAIAALVALAQEDTHER